MNKKKSVVFLLITFIIGFGVVKATPKVVSQLRDNTKEIIDYTVRSFQANEENNQTAKADTHKINDSFSNQILTLQIGNDEITINTNYNDEVFEVNSLFTDAPIEVNLSNSTQLSNDELDIRVNGQNIIEENLISLDSLAKKNYIDIQFTYDGCQRTCFVQTLPTDFPKMEKTGLSIYEGDYYSTSFPKNPGENGFIFKMSNEGEILYYKREDSIMMDFTKWTIDGKERYSYFSENNSEGMDIPGATYGDCIVMNEDYEIIDTVRTLPSKNYNIFTNKAEAHDFIFIDDHHYLLMDYVIVTPNAEHLNDTLKIDTRVQAAYIQEIQDGEVIWEWMSSDYEEFYEGSIENNDYSNSDRVVADYVHINSIFLDPADGNLIMSLRTQDSVIKVDRSTKEILWSFGGKNDDFELSSNQLLSKQHHATMTQAGNLLIFDNGTANEQTRIIEATLDEENKTVEVYKEYQIDDAFSRYTGSVQKIDEENDVFLIGWGMGRENQYALMSEIDFKNNKVLTEVLEEQIETDTYRFLKFK